jgi:hypothetical protein
MALPVSKSRALEIAADFDRVDQSLAVFDSYLKQIEENHQAFFTSTVCDANVKKMILWAQQFTSRNSFP